MAQNIVQQQNRRPAKVRKLRLASLFTDAPVRIEPEEEKKVVVAGLVEANPNKEYPDEYFKRAWAVFRGEFATLFKSALWFFAFTIPFIVIFAWFAKYFENMVLGGTYNFMGDIGVGFPGGGDSIAVAVARLYWEVKTPVLCMLAGTLILGSLGLGGIFYCTKRSYYQDHYKRITKTFWMGFAKFWWKYLVTMTFAVLIGTAMGVSLLYFLRMQSLGAADAGAYCAVIFTWIFGAPLLLCLAGMIVGIIVYAAMAFIGTFFVALFWIAMASRGMKKCSLLAEDMRRVELQNARRAAKVNPYANGNGKNNATVNGTVANDAPQQPKKKPQQNHYQNPKKKKKK